MDLTRRPDGSLSELPYSGATKLIFIVGDPIAQVQSPQVLSQWFRHRGHDLLVVPACVAPGEFNAFLAVVERMANVEGLIITVPHKFAAQAACRSLDAIASRVGSVNLMRRHPEGGWFGAMGDGQGCLMALRSVGFDPAGKRALLIGAGGAGVAVADALVQAGIAELRLCEVDSDRAVSALETLAANAGFQATQAAADGSGCDLVVNATLLGTDADDPLPLDALTLSPTAVVVDLACGPGGSTALTHAAATRGCQAITGDQVFSVMCGRVGEFFLPQESPVAVPSALPCQPSPSPSPPADQLRQLLDGYQATQTIHAAARLGVADHLRETTATSVETLAVAVGAQPEALYRLMRALAALGVFREHEGHAFSLAPMGACLRSDATRSLGAWASFLGETSRWRAWGHLAESVRTGSYAFAAVHGMDCWEYRRRHPEAGELFHAAMATQSSHGDQAVLAACDLRGRRHLGDIGGGRGSLLAAALRLHPSLQGTLVDQPELAAEAEALLTAAGVRERCRLVLGDFFGELPSGCDALMLKCILHDWDDDQAIALLRSCRRAVTVGALLFVVECLLGPANTGLQIRMSDLNMFLGTGGRERSEAEYADLLMVAGFRLRRVVPTGDRLSVLVAEAD